MTVWRRCREAGAGWKSVPEGSFPQLLLFVNFNIADETEVVPLFLDQQTPRLGISFKMLY